MITDDLSILLKHGKQFVPDVTAVELTSLFRGRPELEVDISQQEATWVASICPTGAFRANGPSIDLGRCVFCRECEMALPAKIRFTNDYKISTNVRENLIVQSGNKHKIQINKEYIRPEIRTLFKQTLKLRQVSAGGDNSCEMELNAAGNVNFDMGRFGIEWVASPRHADAVVITGPISENMARALEITYDAIPSPKLVIVVGSDAISSGMFAGSTALSRNFFNQHQVDLFVPGNPAHPLTFINGLLELTGRI
jgi:Ni,Fe-hydrogenase III small subunit